MNPCQFGSPQEPRQQIPHLTLNIEVGTTPTIIEQYIPERADLAVHLNPREHGRGTGIGTLTSLSNFLVVTPD